MLLAERPWVLAMVPMGPSLDREHRWFKGPASLCLLSAVAPSGSQDTCGSAAHFLRAPLQDILSWATRTNI